MAAANTIRSLEFCRACRGLKSGLLAPWKAMQRSPSIRPCNSSSNHPSWLVCTYHWSTGRTFSSSTMQFGLPSSRKSQEQFKRKTIQIKDKNTKDLVENTKSSSKDTTKRKSKAKKLDSKSDGEQINSKRISTKVVKKNDLENKPSQTIFESNVNENDTRQRNGLDEQMSESEDKFASGRVGKKYREGTVGGKLYEVTTLAEINGCLHLGLVGDAQKLFNRYLRIGKMFDIDTFNKVLHGWAEQGNIGSVKMLYNLLVSEGLQPDIATYAALLHAYGKFGYVEEIRITLAEMKHKGINTKHIFYECCLTENQAQGVIRAIRLAEPSYQAETPASHYEPRHPSLVDSIYGDMSDAQSTVCQSVITDNMEQPEEVQVLLNEQLSRELNGVTMIKSIEKCVVNEESKVLKGLFLEWKSKWKDSMVILLEKELQDIRDGKFKSMRGRYAPFLQVFTADELAELTLDEVIFYIKGQLEGVPLHSLSGAVGSALNNKYIVKQTVQSGILKKIRNIYPEYYSRLLTSHQSVSQTPRDLWDEIDLSRPYEASLQQETPDLPWATKLLCGCTLIDFLIQSVKINVNLFNNKSESFLPGFYHSYEFRERRKIGVIKPHPVVCKLFKGYLADHGDIAMATTSVPMLVPPRPWRDIRDGAFLIQPVQLMRSNQEDDDTHDRLLRDKCDRRQLCAVLDALNYLGACAWRTNNRILDLAIQVFNDKGDDTLAIPGPVSELEPLERTGDETPEERMKLIHEHRKARKLAREHYSLRMTALYKLSVANYFREHMFWLPLNMDFRGRVYPIPPHCCHVGDDLSRGMLQFAKGVPLGRDGLRWLKIHLANLYGEKKKASLDERAQYCDEKIEDILDSADQPLSGNCWWMQGDEPWQVLATCIDIAQAIRSPDPTQYVSHQPVHQDGSCNGLQHYAALGHDRYGAKQVNLVPAERPQDVYAEVAKLVEEARCADTLQGHRVAGLLEGKVTRRVVKQTVMTIVYGVTFIGGRLQIERQLRDLGMEDRLLFDSSAYLVHRVFASIGQMFTRAKVIQDWFSVSATHIAYTGNCVDWFTPLSLYVCQPYCKSSVKTIKTKLQGIEIPTRGFAISLPDSRKQRAAFPPNFVHSLDSTHMMLTALHCQRSAITFASVHDSFWTHAAHIDIMNKACREQFVALHTEPVLRDLQKHFQQSYGGKKFTRPLKLKNNTSPVHNASFDDLPEIGDFDVREVLSSTYFFC